MAEVMYGLVSEAKKNRFSAIPKLTEEDIVSVWDNLSDYVARQMGLQKGVSIPGLGVFTFSQKKLDVGNNKYILIQRPVFVLSEKFAMTHGLSYTKHYTTGQIPVVQLNFAALASSTSFDRDTVESCVKEVLQALNRSIQSKRNVEFQFTGIGRLSIRDSKVKMKFYKDFLRSMDGSGSLVQALSNRPGTADSVISEAFTPRPHTSNTLILPRIQPGMSIDGAPQKGGSQNMPTITEEEKQAPQEGGEELADQEENAAEAEMSPRPEPIPRVQPMLGPPKFDDEVPPKSPTRQAPPSSQGSRTPLPTSRAVAVSYGGPGAERTATPPKSPLKRRTESPPAPVMAQSLSAEGVVNLLASRSMPQLQPPKPPMSRMGSRCHLHGDRGGQELCYLCHQRSDKNIPVYFTEERRRKELEQDRLLQQYQHQKDSEAILVEQNKNLDNRQYNQKVAAFNLGVSEGIKTKQTTRPTEFCRSYVFQNRPLTPPRCIKQNEYSDDLADQVTQKNSKLTRLQREKEFLERLEQVQLAEDLALQREQYMRERKAANNLYKKALDTQIDIRKQLENSLRTTIRSPFALLRLPKPRIISPFADTLLQRPRIFLGREGNRVRFKPLPIPALEPDSIGPIFGIHDATEDKLYEQRHRNRKLYKEQLDMVSHKKREAILRDLKNQKEESDMLDRTKRDIILDRTMRHQEQLDTRRSLEYSWANHVTRKKEREDEELRRAQSPGMLIHEQCDKYRRCNQCGRRPHNCGESNVWSESRYIPGSRLMV